MGAWGHEPFDNDDAADFIGDLAEGSEYDFAELFDSAEGYIESTQASTIIAAAELVAAAKSGKVADVPEELEGWVKQSKTQLVALAPRALAAVKKVREDSELKDLWAESDDFAEWEATLASIEKRLG